MAEADGQRPAADLIAEEAAAVRANWEDALAFYRGCLTLADGAEARQRRGGSRVELNSLLAPADRAPEPAVERFRRFLEPRAPAWAAGWRAVSTVFVKRERDLARHAELRHAVRAAWPEWRDAAEIASEFPPARVWADLLACLDDVTVILFDPVAGDGEALTVRGVDRIIDLHALMATRGRGPRPHHLEPDRWLWHPDAMRETGRLPAGMSGSGWWHWPQNPADTLARWGDGRLSLTGEPPFRPRWETTPRHRDLLAQLLEIRPLTTAEAAAMRSSLVPG